MGMFIASSTGNVDAAHAGEPSEHAAQAQTAPAAATPHGGRRHCRFPPAPGQLYCGNHLYLKTQIGERHVPCPVDPTHSVAESKIRAHVKKCTKQVQLNEKKAQPYFRENVNAGSSEDPDLEEGASCSSDSEEGRNAAAAAPSRPAVKGGRAAQRSSYAERMGAAKLLSLLEKIENAFRQVCGEGEPEAQILLPKECEAAMVHSELRPYSSKHGLQQASILGNMQRLGLLPPVPGCSVLELGAGKGYLSLMLSDCWGGEEREKVAPGGSLPAPRKLGDVVLLDERGFRNKADRLLRARGLQRLRIDIKDFDVEGCPGLSEDGPPPCEEQSPPPPPWLCIGKHLCGAATDFALRASFHQLLSEKRGAGSCTKKAARLSGFAVAPCCHHREFELVSWMTGWALCGHAPGDGASDGDWEEEEPEAVEREVDLGAMPSACADETAGEEGHLGAAAPRTPADGAHLDLPRGRRIEIGRMCKHLIDRGRLAWLQAVPAVKRAELVSYCRPEVSGETRLLLAVGPAGP